MTAIRQYLEDHRDDLTSWLQQLIGFATVNPPGAEYHRCADWLARELQQSGVDARVIAVDDAEQQKHAPETAGFPRCNVYGYGDRGRGRALHFNAHFDVVPVSSGWTHPPFSGDIADGRIYGRGSADMKGAIAALVWAIRAVREVDGFGRDVEVSLVCDEETVGALGAGWMARSGLVRGTEAVVCEGASGNQVGVGHNGVLWLRTTVRGKSAHASQPENGVNAFTEMARIVSGLARSVETLGKRPFRPVDDQVVHPTLVPGGTFGQCDGAKTNIVPGEAWFTLDRRIVPGESIDEVEAETREWIHSAATQGIQAEVTVERVAAARSYVLPTDHAWAQAVRDAVATETGQAPEFHLTPGFTDARYFGADLEIPTIGYGPGGLNYHAIDESASIERLLATARIYASLMMQGGR